MIWSDDVCEKAIAKMNTPGSTYADVAYRLELEQGECIHPEQLRAALRRYKVRTQAVISDDFIEFRGMRTPQDIEVDTYVGLMQTDDEYEHTSRFPEPSRVTEQHVLTLDDPNVLIISDIHAPFHSPAMLDRAVHVTKKYFPHITHCMIIGDLFDFSAISNHLNNQPTTSTETDMRAGGKIARSLRKEFELWIGPGNHDERISKKLNSEFSMESLLCGAFGNTDTGLHITDLDYFYIGDDIIAGHPTMYSSKPTGVAAKVALMQRKNTITGHSHKVGITVSDDGVHWTIDNGHCADSKLFYYVRRRMSTFGEMGAGFTILSNGKPFVFGDAITDWSFWK